jgi:hypothetical protein
MSPPRQEKDRTRNRRLTESMRGESLSINAPERETDSFSFVVKNLNDQTKWS